MARPRSPAAGPPSRCWWRSPSSWPTWSASASSPASAFRSRTSPPAFRSCCCGPSAASSRCAGCFPTASSARCFRARAASTISSAGPIIRPSVSWRAGCRRRSASRRPVALAAMAFGEYGKSVLPDAPPLALAIGVVWLVSLVQLTGVRHSSDLSIDRDHPEGGADRRLPGRGFVIGTPQPVSFAPSASDFAHIVSAPFAISLVFVMYSFSGWNAATYIIGEMRMPERNLPRAMLIGNADRARAVCRAQRGVPAHRADRQARRPARRRPHLRQLHLRRIRRPHRRRA